MIPRLELVIESLQREKQDVLVLLNYVELLSILVSKPYTLKFLLASDAISLLQELLSNVEDANATFYMPGESSFVA